MPMPITNYDKVQDALETIKKTCEDYVKDGCVTCPLGDRDGICRLGICPSAWKTRNPSVDAFRILG